MLPLTHPDYSYTFNPLACETCEGRCCRGQSGYIWVTTDEMGVLADLIGVSFKDFVSDFVIQIGTKFSLKEIRRQGEYECLFFDSEKKQCSVYSARPTQCRTFPFWDYFKDHIDEVVRECPGIILSQ